MSLDDYHRNPMQALGDYSWGDYGIFKAHLRLPRPYPLLILKNYPELKNAVVALPKLIAKYQAYLWEKVMAENAAPSMKLRKYMAAGIPPQYHGPALFITEKPKDQEDLTYVIGHVTSLVGQGHVFYLHSAFAENAMVAATTILRAAVDSNVSSYCCAYPNVLEVIKQWDVEDSTLQRLRKADVLLLWAIGSEYTTDFTNVQLDSILQSRKSENKITIMVSSLDPKEFKARYKEEPDGVCIGFKDIKMKQTLADLRKQLETKNG